MKFIVILYFIGILVNLANLNKILKRVIPKSYIKIL